MVRHKKKPHMNIATYFSSPGDSAVSSLVVCSITGVEEEEADGIMEEVPLSHTAQPVK